MTLSQALLEFQKDAPALQRDSLNPHFRSRFISLDSLLGSIVPVLNAHGLVVSQFPTTIANGDSPKPGLRTRITHAESGEFIEDEMLLMPSKDDPQQQGSAITYARRYSLMAALGLVADEDDDANAASSGAAAATLKVESRTTAPDNPAAKAQAAYEAAGQTAPFSEARPDMTPVEYLALAKAAGEAGALPSIQVVHFGKNKGALLGELSKAQLKWYATEWKVQDDPQPYDHRLKQAAIALHAGHDSPEFDIPFDPA